MRMTVLARLVAMAAAVALVSCRDGAEKQAPPAARPAEQATPTAPSETAPVAPAEASKPGVPESGMQVPEAAPSHGAPKSLPPGHPPLSPATPFSGIAPPPEGAGTGANALSWTVPKGWIAETPSSAMRKAQYRVPGPGGDAECVVYYFGPHQGGDAMSNAERWGAQFKQPPGATEPQALLTRNLDVGGIKVLLVGAKGTY